MKSEEHEEVLTSESENMPLGTLEKILERNDSQEPITSLDKELEELSSLYTTLKKHTLSMMSELEGGDEATSRRMNTSKPKPRVSSVYVGQQFSNVIALQTLRINLLKQRDSIEKDRMDRAIKIVNDIHKRTNGDGEGGVPADLILDELLRLGINVKDFSTENMNENYNEQEIDDELGKVIERNNVPSILGKTIGSAKLAPDDTLPDDFEVYYDEDEEKIFLTNSKFEIIREISEDDAVLEEQEDHYFSNKYQKIVVFSSELFGEED